MKQGQRHKDMDKRTETNERDTRTDKKYRDMRTGTMGTGTTRQEHGDRDSPVWLHFSVFLIYVGPELDGFCVTWTEVWVQTAQIKQNLGLPELWSATRT